MRQSLLSIFFVLCLTGPGCGMVATHLGKAVDPADDTVIFFEVPKGANARSIAGSLQEYDIIQDAGNFQLYVKLSKEGGCIKAGRFRLRRSMSAGEILQTLCGTPVPDDTPFTVVEGWRIREIDAALSAKGWTQPGEYTAAATNGAESTYKASFSLPQGSLEGFLYPDTYMVQPDRWNTVDFVQRQIALFEERFARPKADAVKASGRTLYDVVIMASLLEREEPKPSVRPLVAGILWKRLDSSWNLGVDATSRYTLEKWNDRKAFLKKLRDPNDVYNTRLRPGLPPTPIGNPAVESLNAAIQPEASEYWFYLHDSTQTIHPAKSAAGHEANRRKYNVW